MAHGAPGAHGLDDARFGALGERVVARALQSAGWRVLGRRVVTRAAEVDLVALDGELLVVVEVKSGRAEEAHVPPLDEAADEQIQGGEDRPTEGAVSERWRPGHRFGADDLERVRRAAAMLAGLTPEAGGPAGGTRARLWRVDLVEVFVTERACHLRHHVGLEAPLPHPAPAGFGTLPR